MTIDKTTKRRVLVCGLGSIGRRHVRTLKDIEEDIEVSILRSGLGITCKEESLAETIFFSIKDALNWNPEAVIIASPAHQHLDQALYFARHSIPILVEKPIGVHYSHQKWEELVYLSSQNLVVVGYVLRHDPLVQSTIQYLKNNEIGSLISADFHCGSWLPDWRPGQDYRKTVSAIKNLGGGVLLELSHEIDLAQYLFGRLELEYAYLSNSSLLDIESSVEDNASLALVTESQRHINIRLDFCSAPSRRCFLIRGHKGEIFVDLINRKLTISIKGKPAETHESDVTFSDLYTSQMIAFLNCQDLKGLPACSVTESLQTLEIISKANNYGLIRINP